MTTKEAVQAVEELGLKNVTTKESAAQVTIIFSIVPKVNEMNKIGVKFRNKFKGVEIGWGSDWIAFLK